MRTVFAEEPLEIEQRLQREFDVIRTVLASIDGTILGPASETRRCFPRPRAIYERRVEASTSDWSR